MSAPAYLKFFGRDLFIFTIGLKKSEKAALFDAIIHLNMYGFWPENIKKLCEKSKNFSKNFAKIDELFSKSLKNYEKTCERNAQNARKKSLKNKENSNPLANHSFNTETEKETETDIYKQHTTAPKSAGSKPKSVIQQFSNRMLENFEPNIDSKDPGKVGVWYRANCKYFSEILKYCNNDLDLAEGCVYACVTKLEKLGLTGGYAAVVRHLPEYYTEAKKQLELLNNAKG